MSGSDTAPGVSVCIATYNRKEKLIQAVRSIKNQTFKDLEIIIVDDGSTDGTGERIVREFGADPVIRYVRHIDNKGLSAARNTALKNARGRYYTFLDDDDLWDPAFVASFIELASGFDDTWCFCCGNRIQKAGGVVLCTIPQMSGSLIHYIAQGYTPPVAGQFYSTSQLRRIGGFNEKIRSGVDHDLWLRLAFSGAKIWGLRKCLACANVNKKRASMTTSYENRVNNIRESLRVWRNDIVKYMGDGFYRHFRKSYESYLCEKFFAIYLLRWKLFKALDLLRKSPYKSRIIAKTVVYIFHEIEYRIHIGRRPRLKKRISKPLFPRYTDRISQLEAQ